MHCKACVMLISEALEEAGAKNINVKLDEKRQIGTVTLNSELSKARIAQIIAEQGEYEVE